MKNKVIKSNEAIKIELGSPLPKTAAGRFEIIMELAQMTNKTGKRGRPKKLFTKQQLRDLLTFEPNE